MFPLSVTPGGAFGSALSVNGDGVVIDICVGVAPMPAPCTMVTVQVEESPGMSTVVPAPEVCASAGCVQVKLVMLVGEPRMNCQIF
jgi:hypothetical protein